MAPRSRKVAWLRDELILALDLYVREGPAPPVASRQAVSDLLRAIPIEPELTADPTFRSRQAVEYKLYNFVAVDPSKTTTGFSHGGQGDVAVWDEFVHDPARLSAAAGAIRANLSAVTPGEAEADEGDIADAAEGALLTRVHRVRERSAKLVAKKKEQALLADGSLSCEGCQFDFALRYGERGIGFIECHHTIPVHSLRPGSRTRLGDLALVCSNCHRIIHRRSPWLKMDELRAVVEQHSAAAI